MKKIRIRMKKLAVLLLMVSVFTMAFGETATPASAEEISSGDVVINEIAWMGTDNSTSDEWIELKNTTNGIINLDNWTLNAQDGSPSIVLEGDISANGYYLLERTDDTTVPDILADKIYSGALGDSGEFLELRNADNILIDEINASSNWPAGKKTEPRYPMERCISGNWYDSDAAGGTPKAENGCTEEQCDDADEDGICDGEDNCLNISNSDQADADGDGIGDVCDNCPAIANPNQEDADENGIGDACEGDGNGNGDTLFVTELYPADDSINVSISVKPYLEFSKALDLNTIIGADNIQLRKYAALAADSTQIAVNLSLENNDKKVVFNLAGNLDYETQYYFYIGSGVKDADGNPIESENKWLHGDRAKHEFTTELTSDTTPSDTIPPVCDNGLPTGELAAGTTETTLSLTTDENATCRYSTTENSEYSAMTNTFSTTGETDHSTLISGLENGSDYAYYVRCQDNSENSNTDDYEIPFSVASPQSSGGSGGFTPASVSSSNKLLDVLSFQEGELTQKLNGENKVKVKIPKGSVKSRTTFTASKGSLANSDVPKNKIGAFLFNGLVFNIEAVDLRGDTVRNFSEDLTITLTVPNLLDDTSNLELYYYDEENQEWIIISDVEFGDNIITFKVNHLTQFAVFEIPSPTVKGVLDIVLFDGDVIRNPNAQGMAQFDVYVVKIIGGKKFKRLILNPDIFESYGHLDWENIKLVDQAIMDSFALSNLARCCGANVEAGNFKVYRLIPKNDAGIKQHLNITAVEFGAKGYDWNSVYMINAVDRDAYLSGPDII